MILLINVIYKTIIATEGNFTQTETHYYADNVGYEKSTLQEVEYNSELPENYENHAYKLVDGVIKKILPKYIRYYDWNKILGPTVINNLLDIIEDETHVDRKTIRNFKHFLDNAPDKLINTHEEMFINGMSFLLQQEYITQEIYNNLIEV